MAAKVYTEKDADMRPIDLPDAKGDPRRPEQPAAIYEYGSEGDSRSHARAEDEDLGRVREAEARRDPQRPQIVRDVRDQDDEHRQPAEEVQPQVALAPQDRELGRQRAPRRGCALDGEHRHRALPHDHGRSLSAAGVPGRDRADGR